MTIGDGRLHPAEVAVLTQGKSRWHALSLAPTGNLTLSVDLKSIISYCLKKLKHPEGKKEKKKKTHREEHTNSTPKG